MTALKWDDCFKCQGIETLADFKAVIEEINSVDPGSYNLRCPVDLERNAWLSHSQRLGKHSGQPLPERGVNQDIHRREHSRNPLPFDQTGKDELILQSK